MKITNLKVVDPRQEGHYKNPCLLIQVDEPVEEIAAPAYFSNGLYIEWRTIPCGPFVAVEHKEMPPDEPFYWSDAVDIGSFNATGNHHEQLVGVSVYSPGEGELDLFMGVQRAQRLLRKFRGRAWVITVDEHAAMAGQIVWRLKRKEGLCFSANCRNDAKTEVWYAGTWLNFCQSHLREHNASVRNLRLASGS